jgi:hypothetical protein
MCAYGGGLVRRTRQRAAYTQLRELPPCHCPIYIYSHARVFIDRRLRTDHPCGMPYVRAHVRGHERPCVRARARVVCVYQCAMGDGSAVCARVGGLVLRARPETRNREPCEPLPVGVDRVRLRRAGVLLCVGFQREHRRVEHRVRHHVVLGMRRFRPGGAHYGGRARPGFGAARPVVRGGTADARARAHTCRHSLARAHGCRYGCAEGRLGACIRIYTYICVCVCSTLTHTLSIYLYM